MEQLFTNMYYQKISPWHWLWTENFYMLWSEEGCLPPRVRPWPWGDCMWPLVLLTSPTSISTCRLSSLYVEAQGLNFVFSCPRLSIWRNIKLPITYWNALLIQHVILTHPLAKILWRQSSAAQKSLQDQWVEATVSF